MVVVEEGSDTKRLRAAKEDPAANIVVSPSDHAILKEEAFIKTVQTGLEAVENDSKLVTIGIQPHKPETGYGYIQFLHGAQSDVKKVKTFTEKPDLELAEKFIESGEYVWNSGIFIWNVQTIISAFEQFLPDMAEIFDSGDYSYYTKNEDSFIKNAYSMCKNISIDYGVMEKAQDVYVVLGDFGWSSCLLCFLLLSFFFFFGFPLLKESCIFPAFSSPDSLPSGSQSPCRLREPFKSSAGLLLLFFELFLSLIFLFVFVFF